MAIHSSTIAWKIPWAEEPGRLQSTGSESNTTERLNTHTKVTNTLIFGWEDPLEKEMVYPLQCSCLENPHGQNYNKISPHTSQNGHHHKVYKQ